MTTVAEPIRMTYHPRYINRRPTKLLTVWKNMKARCRDNPNMPCWHRYGGRGIDMCDAWYDNYDVFAGWCLGNGWSEGLTIDRVDNECGYDPWNVRFVTLGENIRNRERTKAQVDSNAGDHLKGYWARVKSGEIEHTGNIRAVECVETGVVYKSGSAASKAFGFSRKACCVAITRGGKMGGFHWRYATSKAS